MKLTVIGLDGAHWELLKPWIQEGSLPNIEKVIECGVRGDMKSCLPPVTLPNWKCYSTGKNPGKIGIFWWENIDFKKRRIYHPFHRKFENPDIWDYISNTGKKVGIIGVPGTYPPKKVNGFIIAGGPDAEERGFTYPKKLEDIIRDKYGWKNRPQNSFNINKEKAAEEVRAIIDVKFKVAKALAREYRLDFLQITSFHINSMHHFLWNHEKTKECWKIIDSHLGDFIKEGESNLMLVSDHGSNEIKTVFNINTWLEKNGYLKTHKSSLGASKLLYKAGITQEQVVKLLDKVKLRKLGRKVPTNLVERIPSNLGQVKKKTSMINWEKSKAISSGQGPLYLNPANQQEKNKMVKELKHKLESLEDSRNREKIIEKVYLREEVYRGRYLNEAPDLIIDQAKGVHIPGGIGDRNVFSFPRRWRAENKKWGLFAAYGPDIKSGKEIRNISILDLAPTILHMFNIPITQDMDGRVLSEIFHSKSKIAQRRMIHQESGEKERVKERVQELKRLGKI